MLANTDIVLIQKVMKIAKYLHDDQVNLYDATVGMDSSVTGLIARLNALPEGEAQAELDLLGGLGGMSFTEFKDLSYVITALIQPVVTANKAQLSAAWKLQ